MQRFSIERLGLTDATKAGEAAFLVISSLQHLTPEQQLAGMAVAFQLSAQKYHAHVGTVLTVANNLVDRALHLVPALGAVESYLANEI